MHSLDPTNEELPLRRMTPAGWARHVLADPVALLNDHAHLEKKAAANALDLMHRWPEIRGLTVDVQALADQWVQTMTSVAKDEIEHLGLVVRLLTRRGGHLSRTHSNPYAKALRDLVRLGDGNNELMDRLLVSALIEARSCERFEVLAGGCEDDMLAKLYRGLCSSERGHFRIFLQLARLLPNRRDVDRRWSEMLDAEAKIIAAQPATTAIHSWAG